MSQTVFNVLVKGNLKKDKGLLSIVLPNCYKEIQSGWKMIFNEIAYHLHENYDILSRVTCNMIRDTKSENSEDTVYFPTLIFVHLKGIENENAHASLTKTPFIISNFAPRLQLSFRFGFV